MEVSYFDRIDEHDNLIGGKASYDEVHGEGLWHRGVHVIIYTPDQKILMQKRAPSLKYHPNEIEISVGGGVDTGETPLQAIAREIKEELGLVVNEADLHFIGKTKSNHHTKNQINKVFIYNYSLRVPSEDIIVRIDGHETIQAFFITKQRLRRALKRHRIARIGKISSLYAYWSHLLDSIEN